MLLSPASSSSKRTFFKMCFSVWCFLIIVLISSSAANPYPHDSNENPQDSPEEKPATNVPRFITKPSEFHVLEGEKASLPCEIEDLGEYVPLWKFNKSQVLFAGNLKINPRDQYDLDEQRTLIINKVTNENQGIYSCFVSTKPPNEIDHYLYVLSAPLIEVHPPNGSVFVQKGGSIRLTCKVIDNNENTKLRVYWTREGGSLPENHVQTENELIIPNANSNDKGSYQCKVSNEIGERTAKFRVQVIYAPQISVPQKVIHNHLHNIYEVSLECQVDADPPAIISWKRNEHPIGPTDKYEIRQNDTHSILVIKKVNENDHGNYTCVATNSIGMTKQNILITQSPSQPIVTSEPIGHDKHFYWLSWHVNSAFPIQLYNLIYREVSLNGSETDWNKVNVESNDQTEDEFRFETYKIDNLKSQTSYEVRIEATNKFGSTWSEPFSFVTSDFYLDQPTHFSHPKQNASAFISLSSSLVLTMVLLKAIFNVIN